MTGVGFAKFDEVTPSVSSLYLVPRLYKVTSFDSNSPVLIVKDGLGVFKYDTSSNPPAES